jgi:outer membrane protein assembly factor BamB
MKENEERRHIPTIFLVVMMIASVLAMSPLAAAADWPMWRNDASNTGDSPETINLPLTEQWHSSAPSVEENGAVVSNGIVYMSTDDGKLYAFNVSTGSEVSGFPVTTGLSYGTPAVDSANQKVYALTRDSKLYAFNLDGTSAWTADVGSVGYNYNEGPIIDESYVYIKAGGGLKKYSSDGSLQWSSPTSGTVTQPSIMGDYVYVNSESGQIRKYGKATGTEVTTGGFPISTASSQSGLTTVNGKIFHKADLLYAYNANDGSLLWSQPHGGYSTHYGSPAVSSEVVYVYGWDGIMYAFDENTGATMTGFPSVDLNPGGDRNWGSPTTAGDKIFIGAGTSQKLKVLGAAGTANAGQVLAEYPTFSTDMQGFDMCSPVISDGVVFAMLDGGGLYAFFGAGTPWPGGAITINSGADCTESQDVTLTLDKGSNTIVTEMRISEDPLFAGAVWEPYSETKAWTLSSGFGTKTVYVQFKDSTGQLSNVFNDQIEYSDSCGGVVTVESADISGATQDVFQTGDSVYAVGSGYSATTTYDLYVVEDTTWVDGMAIPSRVAGTETSVTTDGSGDIPAGTLIWTSSVEGEYDIVVDVGGNGQYDASTDGLDSGSPGFVVRGIPSAPVPALAPIGIIALISLLCVIGMIRIRRRFN